MKNNELKNFILNYGKTKIDNGELNGNTGHLTSDKLLIEIFCEDHLSSNFIENVSECYYENEDEIHDELTEYLERAA